MKKLMLLLLLAIVGCDKPPPKSSSDIKVFQGYHRIGWNVSPIEEYEEWREKNLNAPIKVKTIYSRGGNLKAIEVRYIKKEIRQ